MPTMTHLFLLLAVIMGTLQIPAHASETSPDYGNDENYDDDDASRSPGNLAKSTATPLVPYFDQKATVVYVQPNATNVKLECPVKNYDGNRHSVLWYRDKTLVINGNQPIIDIYTLDSQLVMSAPIANATGHSFNCEVMPVNLSHQITVKVGAPPAKPSSAPTVSWPSAVESLILSALLLIHRAAAHF